MKKIYTIILFVAIAINLNAQPANDSCNNSIVLPVNTNCTFTLGDLANATVTGSVDTFNIDVWYSFTATSNNARVTVVSSPGLYGFPELYGGACGTNLQNVMAWNTLGDTVSCLYNSIVLGSVYWVRVSCAPFPSVTTFNICITDPGNNAAPVPLFLQNNDTIIICTLGDTAYINQSFTSVEAGQTTTIYENLNGFPNCQEISNVPGNIATSQLQVVGSLWNYGWNQFTYIALDDGMPVATTFINIWVLVDTNYCAPHPYLVWPGDANSDSVVNNNDLLPIGLYYMQTGTPRAIAGNLWQGDTATNFGIAQINGADLKHADCNGDGVIDANDTLAINLNFNLIHAIHTGYTDEKLNEPDIYFVTSNTSYYAGDMVDVEVWAGSALTPVSNLYGLAFDIHYTTSLVQLGTESITYPPGWLGTPGTDAIKIAKIDPLANTAYGAITRINHTNASGYGKIADFKFQVNTNVPSSSLFNLSFSSYSANNESGSPVLFNTSGDSLLFVQIGAGVSVTNNSSGITISPNPFTSKTTISFSEEQKHTTIKITDVLGKEIKTITFSGKEYVIEKGEMERGIYFVRIEDEKKNVVNKKIVVQ